MGNAPWKHDRSGFAFGREPRLSTKPAPSSTEAEDGEQPRTDCPEAKGSQPFGRLASSPPSKAAEHPSVTSLLPRTPGVRTVAPREVHRAKFPWRRGAPVGLTSWPRSSFYRPPAKADDMRENQGAFHRSSRARAEVALFACSLGLSVTPPQRGIASVRPAPFVLRPSASP